MGLKFLKFKNVWNSVDRQIYKKNYICDIPRFVTIIVIAKKKSIFAFYHVLVVSIQINYDDMIVMNQKKI